MLALLFFYSGVLLYMYIFYGWLFHLDMYNKSKSMHVFCSGKQQQHKATKSQKNNAADSTIQGQVVLHMTWCLPTVRDV